MLDSELSQLEQRMVASHLARCSDCRSFEESVRELTLRIRSAPLESPRTPVVVRRARRAVLSAANVSAAAVLAVAALGVASQVAPSEAHSPTAGASLESDADQLFSGGWTPEREIAQIDAGRGLERPGPTHAI
jgi:hypothetical protein